MRLIPVDHDPFSDRMTVEDVRGAVTGNSPEMPRSWSPQERERARGVNPMLLSAAARAANAGVDIRPGYLGGVRDQETQDRLVAQGRSKTRNSNHMTGEAIDLWPGGNPNAPGQEYVRMAGAMKQAAAQNGNPITWGGDWRSFVDKPHFELSRNGQPVRPPLATAAELPMSVSSQTRGPKLVPVDHDPFAMPAPQRPDSIADKPGKSFTDAALSPLAQFPETYHGMRRDAQDQMARGLEQLRGATSRANAPTPEGETPSSGVGDVVRGIGNVALGGVGYVASPINAAIRSFVGRPVQDATGIPAEYTDFAASLAIPGIGMTRVTSVPTQAARQLTQGERAVQAGENLAGIGSGGSVPIPRAVASDSMMTQRVAAGTRNIPLAGDPLVSAAENTLTKLGQKSQAIADEYGAASTMTAGDSASKAIRNWITDKSADTSKKFYDRVDAIVDNTILTDLAQTRQIADGIVARRLNAAITEPSQAVKRIHEAINRPGLNYEGVKDLRTYIGELKDNPHLLPADLSGAELEKIYGALSKDLRSAVINGGGQPALSAFERANTHYRLVSDRRGALAKIVGADGNTPAEKVFDNIVAMAGTGSRADMAKLSQARKAMGNDEWNEVASALIARMGRSEDMGARIASSGNLEFSPQKFLTAYRDKLSEQGRAILFRSGGKQSIAPYLDDIAAISERFKELQKFANPSGTGQSAATFGLGMGAMADPLTTITGIVGARVVASALAAPATVAPVAQWSRRYEVALRAPSPANVAMLTIASRNLANTINAKFGLSVTPQDFLRAIQGGVPSRADDTQPEPERVINR